MLFRLNRFFEGRVYFTAEDGFSELFIETLRSAGAVLHDLKITGTRISANVADADLSKVKDAAERSGMKIVFRNKTGFRTLLQKIRFRIGIPVGMAIGFLLFQALCCVIWSVEVTGLEQINADGFISYLEKNNIKSGVFTVNVDCNEIELLAEKYDEKVLRATVNLVGTKLYVHVQERSVPAQPNEYDRYCDLIAAKDGEILKTDIFAGEQKAAKGDHVLKGDVLASGITQLKNGELRPVEAKGQVIAKTETSVTCIAAKRIKAQRIINGKDRRAVYLFGLVFPPLNMQYPVNEKLLRTKNSVFPLGSRRQRVNETETVSIDLTLAQSKLISLNDLALSVYRSFGGAEIEKVTVSVDADNQTTAQGTVVCKENIAEPKYFETINK